MKIYIIRHGKALSQEDARVSSDAQRPLSEEGRKDIASLGQHLKVKGARLEIIFVSPLLRAQQTANILSQALNPKLGVKTIASLNGQDSIANLWEILLKEIKKELSAQVPRLGVSDRNVKDRGQFDVKFRERTPSGTVEKFYTSPPETDASNPTTQLRNLGLNIALVGHMPQLGEFIAWLLKDKPLELRPGSAVALHIENQKPAQVLWIQNPS